MKAFLFSLLALFVISPLSWAAEPPAPKKVAVLIGVDNYDSPRLSNLQYAGRDAVVLGLELENHGFTTTVLTTDLKEDRQPTKKNIEAAIKKAGQGLTKNDVLLIHFSGQGLQFDDDKDYLCPRDAIPRKEEAKTLLALSDLLSNVDRIGAGNSFVLIDACRTDNDTARGIAGSPLRIPFASKGLGILLGCSSGERSYESPNLKHGLFSHAVITGLRGEAKDRSGKITWDSLAAYVRDTVPESVKQLNSPHATQQPQLIANLVGPSFVFVPVSEPKLKR